MKSFQWSLLLILTALLAAPGFADDPPVTVKKEVETVDPSGTWRWEYDLQGSPRKDALMLNLKEDGKVVGTYVGNGLTKVEVKSGQIEGNKLSLEVPFEYQGTEYIIPVTGLIEKDQISGTVKMAEQEFPWNPKRSVTMDDMLGTWQFEIESPNGGTLEPTLTITKNDEDEYAGKYVSQQGTEIDVNKMEIDDENNFVLAIATEYQGTPVSVDYKGRAYGDSMQGELDYDFGGNTGEAEFSAKRKAEKKTEIAK